MQKCAIFEVSFSKYIQNISILSAEEIKHIDDVLARLLSKSAIELSDFSHSNTPWAIHEDGEVVRIRVSRN